MAQIEQELAAEMAWHMSIRQGVRSDMERVIQRLESQVERSDNGLPLTLPAQDATDVAMRAMKALACTIPPYPVWMERDNTAQAERFLQPSSLAQRFAMVSSESD